MLFFIWLLYAITTCPYSAFFYAVAVRLFSSFIWNASASPVCLQWPVWKGIKLLCHFHTSKLIFISTKLLHFGTWLCSDTTGHHWQIQVRSYLWRKKNTRGHCLSCGNEELKGVLGTVLRENLGKELWGIHAEFCRPRRSRRDHALLKSNDYFCSGTPSGTCFGTCSFLCFPPWSVL